MTERVELRLYTAAQLKDWLLLGHIAEGLSDELIDRTRAYALVNNPFVSDEMVLVSALFVDGELAAYTYVFPDRMERPFGRTLYFATALHVKPKYEGRGYAYCVVAAICELYGDDYLDLDAAEATVEVMRYQGMKVRYLPQYVLRQKAISGNSIKARIARVWEYLCRNQRSKEALLRKQLAQSDYELQYVNYLDDATYAFIKEHACGDLLLRRRETFDWILQHPLMQESPLRTRVRSRCWFASAMTVFRLYGVVVRKHGTMVGFVILRASQHEWAVKYIYYDPAAARDVFLAVTEHLLAKPKAVFTTANRLLHVFVAQYGLFACDEVYQKSFAYPSNFNHDETLEVQAGEGDNVT